MSAKNYDVIVVGAGAAGLTAAIGLARAGFTVCAVEAAPFPGAENWSGCVYFCENLAHPDILGTDGVEALAWERRLVERGFFGCDGYSLLGMKYRHPQAFRHCYTVLRPIYDHHLAQVAVRQGVALLTNTTGESLIREAGRVVGVGTNRGPLYADLVFLAEGDASQLVTREGYERFTDHRETPKFLQGIKQVIDLPPGVIEERFGVGPQEGVAYEMLLRNGTLRGKKVHLNMGGFIYTNRHSLSVGLVLPADNLREHFDGDPNLLLEWFERLPALEPWLQGGKQGVFGAKIIRGGGAKDIPNLIDNGLAIGGAASAIGIDFPYPNFTGPATAMGLLVTQAACRIRQEGGDFTRDQLRKHYLEPLQRTHYWQDVEFLRRWPGYVKRTEVFFGRNLDLALGTAYIWTRPGRWFLTKWTNWLRLVMRVAGPGNWRRIQSDLRHLARALRMREVLSRPAWGRLLLDGTMNALRDLAKSPRPNLPTAGTIRLHYTVAGSTVSAAPPRVAQRWFRRLAPVLASAAGRIYTNDNTPLAAKLPYVNELFLRQINLLDLVTGTLVVLAAGITGSFMAAWDRFLAMLWPGRPGRAPRGLYPAYTFAARQATDLTSLAAGAGPNWDTRLGTITYQTAKTSHIRLLWPKSLQNKNAVVEEGLWHVCPARVYEARISSLGQLQVVVNFENCIKCETCWRTSPWVDWGRDGQHRFIYPVTSAAVGCLLEAIHAAGSARPALPHTCDRWETLVRPLAERFLTEKSWPLNGQDQGDVRELYALVEKIEGKIDEYDYSAAKEPRLVDRARAEHLEMLARYAQQLALRLLELLRASPWADSSHSGVASAHKELIQLATALLSKAEERARRTWDQRFAWAAGDGRQMRDHHLTGIRRLLDLLNKDLRAPAPKTDPARQWLRAEDDFSNRGSQWANQVARLDTVFSGTAWREMDRGAALTLEQDVVLRDLVAQVPLLDQADLGSTLHPPYRKALLADLGRRDPSLAYRVACHLWARDLATLVYGSPALAQAAERWARGDEWACFAIIHAVQTRSTGWTGEGFFVPASKAGSLLLLLGNVLVAVPTNAPRLRVEPLATLGLRGAGLASISLDNFTLPDTRAAADHDRFQRVWLVLSALDLTSIAFGMTDQLCSRAGRHAINRVQFPGSFHDEESRDTIGKFGVIKKMVAEMEARRYVLETLDRTLSSTDFSASSVERARLAKAIAAEALGTAPGSVAYNAGQIFGGTGFSEDDILSRFYRDAAAWRFLGAPNREIFLKHGEQLLRNWHGDGRRLASVDNEALLFDELIQRKALQAELDEVRVHRSRLRGLVNDWQDTRRVQSSHSSSLAEGGTLPYGAVAAEVAEHLGRQDAYLLASKALLLRTHARLEYSFASEIELALVRVWLGNASVCLEEFESLVRQSVESAGRREDRPLLDPSAGPPVTHYADYLTSPSPYDSGDFLGTPTDLVQPRLVPEIIDSDPTLASRNAEIRKLLSDHFGRRRGDGLIYERHIERQHRPDPDDLAFLRQHGFFRMPIPISLGGEDRNKLDYYLVTTNAQRLADFAISLTIQVNTSIGTTPILLARNKDLPKAQKELAAFVGDKTLQKEVESRLAKLLALLNYGRLFDHGFCELQKRLEEMVFSRVAVRTLAHRFVQAWQEAGRAHKAFDLAGLQARLGEAAEHWKNTCARAEEMHKEILCRREACDLALRWIASGQISAFALTEPSAGSDTARVATRARLCSAPLEVGADGTLRFVPAGGKQPRVLLDAKRLEFHPNGVSYRWSENADPARISFEEYDYETDDPKRMRYYQQGARRIYFTDIAQVRERHGRLWYDYWELTGSKMWITNGRMAGIMALYAKTDEGVTGFIVDRHAEGLLVGKDEEKMGQCGSPTNELALQAVRVPRENVLGLEGRGQVNALETLNVGRAGLAMSAMAQMAGLIEHSRAYAQAIYGTVPDWVTWRLQRMEEDRYSAEAMAYEVIGRFDHPQTKSVRMESALAKMLVTELLHRMIEHAEDIYGLAGQTQLHLIEKRKRDARVLTIYEGTNEIQRFLVLKELATEVAPRWPSAAPPLPPYLGREALELEALKAELRQRTKAALSLFGQDLWQNPNLQANCFLLSEAVAWLKAADSALGRLAWLERHGNQAHLEESAEPQPRLELARAAVARCHTQVRHRLRRFDEELAHLRRGYYAPEIRAATMVFTRHQEPLPPARPASQVMRPLSILVVVEPTAGNVPYPYVVGERLLEPYFALTDADRSALETALSLRDQAIGPVSIQVLAVGPKGVAPVLREALSLGADRVRLIVSESDAVTPHSAAAALATVLGDGPGFDLILSGSGTGNDEDGLLCQLTAAALGIPFAGKTSCLAVRKAEAEADVILSAPEGRQQRVRLLPAAVTIEAGLPLRAYRIAGYLAGLSRVVELERWPKKVIPETLSFHAGALLADVPAKEEPPCSLSPHDVARLALDQFGLESSGLAPPRPFTGAIEEVMQPRIPERGVLAVLATEPSGRLHSTAANVLQAATVIAASESMSACAILLVPFADEIQRRGVAQILELFSGTVVLWSALKTQATAAVSSQLLKECWSFLDCSPAIVVGEPWTEEAFAVLSQQAGKTASAALRVRRVGIENDQVLLESSRMRGKLRVKQRLALRSNVTFWITLATEATIAGKSATPPATLPGVQRWAPRLERFYGQDEIQRLLADVKEDTGLLRLADADFVIDVGFGVGNRDGYETVVVPLERALRELGVRNLVVGGSRKVTEELHLLPADHQIGQSGVSVNPQVLMAIGVSGAPQHLNYIGSRATILAFNRDPEAPIMTMNKRQPRPKVYPIVGDLFESVPAFITALRKETAGTSEATEESVQLS